MLELGKASKEIHEEIEKLERFPFNILYTVGKNMFEMSKFKKYKMQIYDDNLEP